MLSIKNQTMFTVEIHVQHFGVNHIVHFKLHFIVKYNGVYEGKKILKLSSKLKTCFTLT